MMLKLAEPRKRLRRRKQREKRRVRKGPLEKRSQRKSDKLIKRSLIVLSMQCIDSPLLALSPDCVLVETAGKRVGAS
jgi:hypothetical protein